MDISGFLGNIFRPKPKLPSRGGVVSDMNRDYYPGGNYAPSNQWDYFRQLIENNPRVQKDKEYPGLEAFADDPELLRKFYLELMNRDINMSNDFYNQMRKRKVEM